MDAFERDFSIPDPVTIPDGVYSMRRAGPFALAVYGGPHDGLVMPTPGIDVRPGVLILVDVEGVHLSARDVCGVCGGTIHVDPVTRITNGVADVRHRACDPTAGLVRRLRVEWRDDDG